MTDPACDRFVELAPELASGTLERPWSTELLDHAGTCPTCQRHLDELMRVSSQVLLLAPRISPPPGFEARVLAQVGAARGAPGPPRRTRRWAAAAAAVAAAIGGGFVAGRTGAPHRAAAPATVDAGSARVAAITQADGSVAGTISLVSHPRPLALVLIDHPRPAAGRASCELVGADGSTTVIGSWSFDEIARGAWAVGIDPAQLGARRMVLRSPTGAVVATATFS